MRISAPSLCLFFALAPSGAVASDGGPLSLSLPRAHHEPVAPGQAAAPEDAGASASIDTAPTLSLSPHSTPASEAQGGGTERSARTTPSSGAPPLAATSFEDRSIAFGAGEIKSINELLRTDQSPFELAPRLRLEFSRPTQLRDGGVNGEHSAFGVGQLSAFADDRGEIDLYDIAFRWDAVSQGPVTFSLIGGVKAVAADIVNEVGEYDVSGNLVSTRLDDAYGIAPVPVFGGGVRWDVSDTFYISGAAQTHTIPDGASLLDLTAQTGLDFSPNVGLRAGYQYLRTTVQVQNLDASLSVSGVFARLEITF